MHLHKLTEPVQRIDFGINRMMQQYFAKRSDLFSQLFKVDSGIQVGSVSKRHDLFTTNSGIHSRRYDTLCGQDVLLPMATNPMSPSVGPDF
jgi:hypothetical protein